ncbi:hypothetical protein [Coleofasciculus sp. FACHB-SPT9]|uniref:hypothetical protein n=1 Tax=Cyanophyceae TaxID=3028117 RepID=UPI0016847934|nr:hypothetical protein [Coleofasciculus sp. FACHB-SPT9]MBD1888457.1 hypothetical protein [Coleofasciculus sp. FACHB-SPT9]
MISAQVLGKRCRVREAIARAIAILERFRFDRRYPWRTEHRDPKSSQLSYRAIALRRRIQDYY